MERLIDDKDFVEVETPSAIKKQIFNNHVLEALIERLHADEIKEQAPEALNGVSVNSITESFRTCLLGFLEGQNLLYGINSAEFEGVLKDFVVNNWPSIKVKRINGSELDKRGLEKELSNWPVVTNDVEQQIEVFYMLRDILMSFYRRVQEAITEVLAEKNFVVGTDQRIKREIYRSSNHGGFAVKFCDKAQNFEKPILVPHHPNLMQTSLFPLQRADGTKGMMILTEDITGAKRFDKLNISEIPLEDRMRALIQIIHGCNHLHNFGLVHHDIKPENMFLLENSGDQPIYILGDPECIVPDGYEYPNTDEGIPNIFTTFEFFDYEYFGYSIDYLKKASTGIDVFAVGINIIEQFVGDYDKSKDILAYIAEHTDIKIEESLLRDAFQIFEIEFNIPENILVILLRCLTYYREQRPCLSEVIQILDDEYGQINSVDFLS
jgi:serine/threonine protein kinase